MIRLLTIAILCCAVSSARVAVAAQQQAAHPAVARVIVADRDGMSYGSGALVGGNATYGLVVTNWHVVRDAAGPIMVVFPDGFRSAAIVLRTDRDWDLAALAIWRPNVRPVALAAQVPREGETLTIAGYGPGWYRAASGRCTQYVSPGKNLPYEMVELSTAARSGDSGGPILNSRGELAGVLFGTAFGRTTGSHCGRVRWFLASAAPDFARLPADPSLSPGPSTMIAQGTQPMGSPVSGSPAAWQSQPGRAQITAVRPRSPASLQPPRYEPGSTGADNGLYARDMSASAAVPNGFPATDLAGTSGPAPSGGARRDAWPASQDITVSPTDASQQTPTVDIAGAGSPAASQPQLPTRAEQIETVLAAIGVLALLFHGLRWLSAAQA